MHKSATLVTKLCRDLAPILGDKTHRIISGKLFFNSWLCEFVGKNSVFIFGACQWTMRFAKMNRQNRF